LPLAPGARCPGTEPDANSLRAELEVVLSLTSVRFRWRQNSKPPDGPLRTDRRRSSPACRGAGSCPVACCSRASPPPHRPEDSTRAPRATPWWPRLVVQPFDLPPTAATSSLVVVDRHEKHAVRSDGDEGRVPWLARGPGMVQHAPRIDDIGGAQSADVGLVQHRAAFDGPPRVARTVATAKLRRAGDRVEVIVERVPLVPRRRAARLLSPLRTRRLP
jgi:hypothetical protein